MLTSHLQVHYLIKCTCKDKTLNCDVLSSQSFSTCILQTKCCGLNLFLV